MVGPGLPQGPEPAAPAVPRLGVGGQGGDGAADVGSRGDELPARDCCGRRPGRGLGRAAGRQGLAELDRVHARVEPSAAGPLAVGVTVRVRQPRLPATTWTVDSLVPGRSFSWTSSSVGVMSVAAHAIEPAAQGCRLLLSLTQAGPLASLSGLLLGRLTRRYLRLEAEGLRDRVERGADR